MSHATPSKLSPAEGRPDRLTSTAYLRVVDAGALEGHPRRMELINGRIREMSAQGVPHTIAISRINRVFNRLVPATDWLITQGTIRLDEFSAPDPDMIWLSCPLGTSRDGWPQPLLLIEVSESTYRYDSGL